MSFEVDADAYYQFMGRYSEPLAKDFVDSLAPQPGQRALDVGAGTGAVTARFVEALGGASVAAIDPSVAFVAALRQRLPEVDVRQASAESIPFADASFDFAVAQLVVHFMSDPVLALTEMARVTVSGGVVAASTWDIAGHRAPLSLFWRAARDLDPGVDDESGGTGAREGDLVSLFVESGLGEVAGGELGVTVPYLGPADWWHAYTVGVGPPGEYVARLDPEHREALRLRTVELLPKEPGMISASVWTARGIVR